MTIYRPPDFTPEIPNAARVHNFLREGTDWYPADREAGQALWDPMWITTYEGASFRRRTVADLVRDRGFTNLLDLGTGYPAERANPHQIAAWLTHSSQTLYVDADRLAASHAATMLTPLQRAESAVMCADIRDTALVLEQARASLDLSRPVAVLMMAVIDYIADDGELLDLVAAYVASLPRGTVFVVTYAGPLLREAADRWNAFKVDPPMTWRTAVMLITALQSAGLEIILDRMPVSYYLRRDVPYDSIPWVGQYVVIARKP